MRGEVPAWVLESRCRALQVEHRGQVGGEDRPTPRWQAASLPGPGEPSRGPREHEAGGARDDEIAQIPRPPRDVRQPGAERRGVTLGVVQRAVAEAHPRNPAGLGGHPGTERQGIGEQDVDALGLDDGAQVTAPPGGLPHERGLERGPDVGQTVEPHGRRRRSARRDGLGAMASRARVEGGIAVPEDTVPVLDETRDERCRVEGVRGDLDARHEHGDLPVHALPRSCGLRRVHHAIGCRAP